MPLNYVLAINFLLSEELEEEKKAYEYYEEKMMEEILNMSEATDSNHLTHSAESEG